ncbi:hypothetical protein C8D70_105157 [Chryseobacterium sp. CBTAP 102]|nr:hypothetical protein [Chryseobacterium sp. CBTAP 102]PXW15293.1 hypothetical protein C8D70_105157 [Chryseobacterium sp. CBTAP 102]
MEGKQKFNYDSAESTDKENRADPQEVISKIVQVILGIIMAILHL